MSSQSAVTAVKRHFQAEKAGHTGTLDPMATGLLPICLGEATKYSQDLLDADKTYIATVRFGIETDTGDAEGQVLSERSTTEVVDNLMAKTLLEAILPKFIGEIEQIPPMYSALKRDGKPLYEYARSGVESCSTWGPSECSPTLKVGLDSVSNPHAWLCMSSSNAWCACTPVLTKVMRSSPKRSKGGRRAMASLSGVAWWGT